MRSSRGFTLIEIMVALLIMAGLSLIMAQSVKTGLESRKKIQLQLTEEALIRDAMRLIVSDVAAAFHHRDYTISIYNKVLELRKKKATGQQTPGTVNSGAAPGASSSGDGASAGTVASGAAPTTTPTAPDPLATATPLPVPNQLTGFVGSSDAMTFSVRNHVRRFLEAKESDQARVSYFLRSCQKVSKQGSSSSCLVRMEVVNPTEDFPLAPQDEEDAKRVVLVHDVTEFKLRYIAAGMTDFADSWDSSPKASSAETKDKFPDAVEVTLSLLDKSNSRSKPRTLSWLAPIRNSNNLSEAEIADKNTTTKTPASPAKGQQ